MARYIPVRFYPDRMPVDISYVFENEKPAGKHGFCQVDGDTFKFEDGTPARFWGVIFNGACCFPDYAYAEGVAARLAQAGCNIVRFHQMDAEWATPNIFRLTAGRRLRDTRHFDPVCMERHDYLIKCLKEQGIYIATDVTTYRKFKSGDGVVDADLLSDNMKGVALYDPTMIELQKEYAANYWNHVNQYTGIAYKDDPTFVLLDITNENDLFSEYKTHALYRQTSKYYDDMFRDMFAVWLKENSIEYDAYGCEIFNPDKPMIDFRIHLCKAYFEGMYDYLRNEVGIKIPICGTNWSRRGGLVKSQENMDFQDGHHYYYPIEKSDSLLLSTIGRSRSRGAQFDGEKLIDFGTGPIEVEVIDAEISIKTEREGMRIWSVNSDGYYIGQLEKRYEDGWLTFHVGPHFPGMYYLIMQE